MKKYGFFSRQAVMVDQCPSYVYRTVQGKEVEVTCVVLDDPEGLSYEYPDKVYVGEVRGYVRHKQSFEQRIRPVREVV